MKLRTYLTPFNALSIAKEDRNKEFKEELNTMTDDSKQAWLGVDARMRIWQAIYDGEMGCP